MTTLHDLSGNGFNGHYEGTVQRGTGLVTDEYCAVIGDLSLTDDATVVTAPQVGGDISLVMRFDADVAVDEYFFHARRAGGLRWLCTYQNDRVANQLNVQVRRDHNGSTPVNFDMAVQPALSGPGSLGFTYDKTNNTVLFYVNGVLVDTQDKAGSGPNFVSLPDEFDVLFVGNTGSKVSHYLITHDIKGAGVFTDYHAAASAGTLTSYMLGLSNSVVAYPLTDAPVPGVPVGISYLLYEADAAGAGGRTAYNQPVAIGGHRYSIEWAKYARATVSPFREARDSTALPGENSLNPLAAWKRSRDDWSLGAGQTWADRSLDQFQSQERNLEPRQFRDSKGIDPWTLGQFKLHHDVEVASSSVSDAIDVICIGGVMYMASQTKVQICTSPLIATPVWTDCTVFTGTPLAIASDGERIYLSTDDGMWITTVGSSVFAAMAGSAATYSPEHLLWTNGWLFGTVGNVLSEIRADGTVNMVFTHRNSEFVFAAMCGTPTTAYFGGQATDINEIYRVGVKEDGSLDVGIFSGSLPLGELIASMAYYSGYVLIGTTKGVHLAVQAANGSLNMAPVIRTDSMVKCMAADSRFIWFGWTDYDDVSTGLGRMDLSAFSDQNNSISAWASDLMYTGSGDVQAIVRFSGRTFFLVEGVGLVRESNLEYVAEGTLYMGHFRWGTFEPKVWLGLEVVSDPLTGRTDGTIAMTVTNESGDITDLGTRGPSNISTGVGSIYGVGTISKAYDWFEPQIELRRFGDNNECSPIVRRVTLRALPVPKTIEQYTLPIIMAEKVNDNTGEGGEVAYKTSSEYNFLQGMVTKGTPVLLQIYGEQHLVTVREVGWDSVNGLTHARDGVNGLLMVTLVTAEI